MKYKVWVLFSATSKTCFLSTNVNFEGVTVAGFKRDIPTWNRSSLMQSELNDMASHDDFNFSVDEVTNVDDLHRVADSMREKGYRVLNRRIVLKKSNIAV